MQNLLWIGDALFAPELEACGWENVLITPLVKECQNWESAQKLAGFSPDVLVMAGGATFAPVSGPENFPCLTVFYSLNSARCPWEKPYALAFDACLVGQRDEMAAFGSQGLDKSRLFWLPPFCYASKLPDEFSDLSKKALFFSELCKLLPEQEINECEYGWIMPRAGIIIQYAEDLDFCLFSAMHEGCVVSPRVGQGMENFFVDGEHLVGYAPNDPGDAAYRVKFLLDHPQIIEHIARTGYERIRQEHLAIHRAQAFTDHICDLAMSGMGEIIQNRLANREQARKNMEEAASLCANASK